MTDKILIKNATIVNEGETFIGSVIIDGEKIDKVMKGEVYDTSIDYTIDAEGLHLLPGCIDDQVHFREPGLTHKAEIHTESRAAVAGGITSFMEMPNTVPNTLTQELLKAKYELGAQKSMANYSFFMGASNDNIKEVLKTDPKSVCGVKVFMGSSTGNMLVDNKEVLKTIFSECDMLIATHCEDEETIRKNTALFREKYGEGVPISCHPLIRSEEACYKSSSMAAEMADKYGARLHILHISTAKELELFRPGDLTEKKITAEACIHHLWFTDYDYAQKETHIKWNPAVKTKKDREAIRQAVNNDVIDIIATDHAPHTLAEKNKTYFNAPSGGPLVQHALPAMLEMVKEGVFTLPKIVHKMAHAPALCFDVHKRGFIREGYYADLVLVDLKSEWTVTKDNILYKCGWSPFEDVEFSSRVISTFINGTRVYHQGEFKEDFRGMRLTFDR